MIRPSRLARLAVGASLLLAASALAAEPTPTPTEQDLPSPEQIEQVTKTKPLAGLEDEAPAVLDPVSVDATRLRETAFRTVQVALERPRSDKAADADVVVCQRRQKIGSHITKIYCATNRTWNYIRKETTGAVLGDQNAQAAPYPLVAGPVYELSPTVLARIGENYQGADHAERLAQLAAEQTVGRMNDEWNTPTETIVRFAKALKAVADAGKSGDAAAQERAMTKALADHGFTVEQYNELVARLESSMVFQRRVAAAQQAYKL